MDEQFSPDHHNGRTPDEKDRDLQGRRRSNFRLGVEDGRAAVQPEHQPERRHHEQRALNPAHRPVVPEDEREEGDAQHHGDRPFARDAHGHRGDEQRQPEGAGQEEDRRTDHGAERDLGQPT